MPEEIYVPFTMQEVVQNLAEEIITLTQQNDELKKEIIRLQHLLDTCDVDRGWW